MFLFFNSLTIALFFFHGCSTAQLETVSKIKEFTSPVPLQALAHNSPYHICQTLSCQKSSRLTMYSQKENINSYFIHSIIVKCPRNQTNRHSTTSHGCWVLENCWCRKCLLGWNIPSGDELIITSISINDAVHGATGRDQLTDIYVLCARCLRCHIKRIARTG